MNQTRAHSPGVGCSARTPTLGWITKTDHPLSLRGRGHGFKCIQTATCLGNAANTTTESGSPGEARWKRNSVMSCCWRRKDGSTGRAMKSLLSICLVLTVPMAHAVECGRLITVGDVDHLRAPLTQALELVSEHNKNLLQESKILLRRANSDAQFLRLRTLELESTLLEHAYLNGERVETRLDALGTLISIRESMSDAQDKTIVERHISMAAVHTKIVAAIGYRGVTQLLMRSSRPRTTYLYKLGDNLGRVEKEFQRCERPM